LTNKLYVTVCASQVLLGYRLQWPRRATKALLCFALVYYIATRLLQTVMVLYMIIGWASYPAVRTTAAFIVVATLFGAFSVIQGYTLVIYRAIGRKLKLPERSAINAYDTQLSASVWVDKLDNIRGPTTGEAGAASCGRAVGTILN
jgi:hypothetical protein